MPTLEYSRWTTGEGALLAKRSSPGATEDGVVDVRLVGEAAVDGLAAHRAVPRAMDTLQVCLSLRSKNGGSQVAEQLGNRASHLKVAGLILGCVLGQGLLASGRMSLYLL